MIMKMLRLRGWKIMYEIVIGIIVAIACLVTIVCRYFRNRVFGRTGNTDDNIGNTVEQLSEGAREVNSTVKRIGDTTADITRTSEELGTSIEHSKSSIEDAQGTVTNIRRLIKARRESIEEENL